MAVDWVYTLIVIGFLVGAGLLALSNFSMSMGEGSAEQNATNLTIDAIGNFTEQLPTVGTMIGIGLLILVVMGAIGYFAFKGGVLG